MSDFKVTLTSTGIGWHWTLEKDGYEMSDWAPTKWLARYSVNREIRKWDTPIIVERYTVKAADK